MPGPERRRTAPPDQAPGATCADPSPTAAPAPADAPGTLKEASLPEEHSPREVDGATSGSAPTASADPNATGEFFPADAAGTGAVAPGATAELPLAAWTAPPAPAPGATVSLPGAPPAEGSPWAETLP